MVASPRKVALTDRSLKALKPAPVGKRATVSTPERMCIGEPE